MADVLMDHAFQGYRFAGVRQEGDFTVYRLSGPGGEGELRGLTVFPGAYLCYDRLDMDSCFQPVEAVEGYLHLNHCRAGCYECEMTDGRVCFLGEGDLCVSTQSCCNFRSSRLPTRYYRGSTLSLELGEAQRSLDRLFPAAGLALEALRTGLLGREVTYLIRASPEVEHIFAELYSVDERIRIPYLTLKVIELLLFLSLNQGEPLEPLPRFSRNVVAQTEAAHAFLMKDVGRRETAAQLAVRFHLSETSLRECFRSMYGQPIASFLRARRLDRAARLLRGSELSVGEIALLVGYENQSKFSAAFKASMGRTPLAYRKQNPRLCGPVDETEQK